MVKKDIVGNSVLRADAKKRKDAFSANLYKIKNNSVFGKQMENVRNRVDIVLIKHKIKDDESYSGLDKYIKLCSHPHINEQQYLMKILSQFIETKNI